MTEDAILLTRREPTRNMSRFYILSIEPDLFKGTALTRNWGRIGTKGQMRIELFGSPSEAERRMRRLLQAKIRRGYRLMPA